MGIIHPAQLRVISNNFKKPILSIQEKLCIEFTQLNDRYPPSFDCRSFVGISGDFVGL